MTTVIDTEKVMNQTLYSYLSENVFNSPLMECRRNIVPLSYNNGRAVISVVDLGCQSVDLPDVPNSKTKKSFYVFGAAKCCMGGIVVDTEAKQIKKDLEAYYDNGWLPLDVYLNHRPFDLRFHGMHGEWLYRKDIYITNHPYQDMFLIAVEVKMAQQILGKDYNFKNIWMSVYYDSDNNLNNLPSTSKTITCYHPENDDIETLNNAYNAYASLSDVIPNGSHVSEKGKTMCFIDGRESIPTSLADIKFGQYVEIVQDPDIICNIELDLTKVGENNIYRSSIDDTYKYIIHIPKNVNPENYIISHNTCDLFIRPTNTVVSSDERLKGLFVHRFNTSLRLENGQLIDHMITQITHNDFGVSEKLLMSWMEKLSTTECKLRAVIRRHSKTKVLVDDASFIRLLYNFNDDATIIKFLTGYGDATLDFWRAENLEQTNFCKMFVNFPILTTSDDTNYYVDALGYFNSLSVVTPRVMHRKISNINIRKFDVSIPVSMLTCDAIGLLVYINGVKISGDLYGYERSYQYLIVTLDASVTIKTDDDISFELIDADKFYGEYYTPTPGNNTFWVPTGMSIEVYEVVTEDAVEDYYTKNYPLTDPNSFIRIKDTTSLFQGEPLLSTDHASEGYVFSDSSFNKTYFICGKNIYERYRTEDLESFGGNTKFGQIQTDRGTCTDLMHSGQMMLTAYPFPNHTETTETVKVPIIQQDLVTIVFMNNKELVRDIDYTFRSVMSSSGIKGMILFFNNVSYLQKENNTFEVYVTSDKEFMNFNGFMHNRYTYDQLSKTKHFKYGAIEEVNPYIYWFERLCSGTIDGAWQHNLIQEQGYLKTYTECRQGGLYGTRGLVPLETKEFIDKHSDINIDLERLAAIAEYRRKNAPVLEPEIEVIPYSHHIASITMNAIVKDVLTGKKILSYESDPYLMLNQLEEYESMKKYDAALSGVAKELRITNAGYTKANNVYKLEDATMTGINRKWVNASNNVIVWWNCDDDEYRWEIATVGVLGKTAYYYADDPTGTKDPWLLEWKFVLDEKGQPIDKNKSLPIVDSSCIDLRYLDLFPSYSSDLHQVMEDVALRQAIRALFPVDDIRDGDTVR